MEFSSPSLPPVSSIVSISQEELEAALSLIFEQSRTLFSLLSSHIRSNPAPASWSALISSFEKDVLPLCAWEEKLDIINAHPRLGEPKTNLSAMSLKEQGYIPGQSSTLPAVVPDAEVNAELMRLNNIYEARFGFKFVIFVAGRPRKNIVPILQSIVDNAAAMKESEMERGLQDMCDIARDRVKKLGMV
ncbi:hypothetical protein HDU93_006641 [Gonapodya sp. JEL0774]|nr:hypothetical protein HDU93_006641 [Gonapodya sp. JEL0774]